MANRKSMSETAKLFLKTGELSGDIPAPPATEQPALEQLTGEQQVEMLAEQSLTIATSPPPPTSASGLRDELLGESTESEATVRFTVDLPKSLHRRLQQLSLDSHKPKTELVRIMVRRILDDLKY